MTSPAGDDRDVVLACGLRLQQDDSALTTFGEMIDIVDFHTGSRMSPRELGNQLVRAGIRHQLERFGNSSEKAVRGYSVAQQQTRVAFERVARTLAPLGIAGVIDVPSVKAELDELTRVIAGRLDVIGDPAGHAERVAGRWLRLETVEHLPIGQPWRLIEAALAAAEHDPHDPKIWLDVAGWAVLAASLARQQQETSDATS